MSAFLLILKVRECDGGPIPYMFIADTVTLMAVELLQLGEDSSNTCMQVVAWHISEAKRVSFPHEPPLVESE